MNDLIAVVLPVFNDWDALEAVLKDLAQSGTCATYHVIVVDDGSSTDSPPGFPNLSTPSEICGVEVVRLAFNLGHQRAIAVGLSLAAELDGVGSIVVMDGDGEDRPSDIATLIAASKCNPDHVVVAQRAQRSENWQFRSGYLAYKLLFRLLTGRTIDFGNFCLLPASAVRRLVRMPELWNNLAASVMRSRLRSVRVPVNRGQRVAGRSRMNFPALVLHGFSAMSVYSDVVFARMLTAAGMGGIASILGLLVVAGIRIATPYAIPGWASTVFGDLLIILAQSIVMVVAVTLAVLGTRSQRPIVPLMDAPGFILDRYEPATVSRRIGLAA